MFFSTVFIVEAFGGFVPQRVNINAIDFMRDWCKLVLGKVKCNIDAGFSTNNN
jgi:hypothetical protein